MIARRASRSQIGLGQVRGIGFRCARSDDDPSRPPKATLPQQTTFPLRAPWYVEYRKHPSRTWYREDCDARCKDGCVGFEHDRDCMPHCRLSCQGRMGPDCSANEEPCVDPAMTCGCRPEDYQCVRDCGKRCEDATGYSWCGDNGRIDYPEPEPDEDGSAGSDAG